jgi:hypothetical protein
VVSTVSHVAGGALVLATSVVLAIESRRAIQATASQRVAKPSSRKTVTA